jgi:hypothetical protein
VGFIHSGPSYFGLGLLLLLGVSLLKPWRAGATLAFFFSWSSGLGWCNIQFGFTVARGADGGAPIIVTRPSGSPRHDNESGGSQSGVREEIEQTVFM